MHVKHTKKPIIYTHKNTHTHSVEVAFARAFCRFFHLSISPYQLAHICQKVEHKVALAPCGIMDQIAVSLGRIGCLLPIACRPEGAVVRAPVRLSGDVCVWGIVTKVCVACEV